MCGCARVCARAGCVSVFDLHVMVENHIHAESCLHLHTHTRIFMHSIFLRIQSQTRMHAYKQALTHTRARLCEHNANTDFPRLTYLCRAEVVRRAYVKDIVFACCFAAVAGVVGVGFVRSWCVFAATAPYLFHIFSLSTPPKVYMHFSPTSAYVAGKYAQCGPNAP